MKAFQLQLEDRKPCYHIASLGFCPFDQQGKIERDYEPEQEYGTAHDFQEHVRFGGDRKDY